jgi:hypothetical protein
MITRKGNVSSVEGSEGAMLCKQYQTEAKENEENKAKVLETQFVELNKAMEGNPERKNIASTESIEGKLGTRINIKIRSSY